MSTLMEEEILREIKKGYSSTALAKRYDLTAREIDAIASMHFLEKHENNERTVGTLFHKLICHYEEDISQLAIILDNIPHRDYKLLAEVFNVKNRVRDSLVKTLKECDLLPRQQVETPGSGWQEMQDRFFELAKKNKLTLTESRSISIDNTNKTNNTNNTNNTNKALSKGR